MPHAYSKILRLLKRGYFSRSATLTGHFAQSNAPRRFALTVTPLTHAAKFVMFAVKVKRKVVAAKRVTLSAMCLISKKSCDAVSTLSVFQWRNRLDVCGIDTVPNTAKMVALQFFRNFFDKQLINQAVREKQSDFCDVVLSVAGNGIGKCRPFPARNAFVKIGRRYFDFGKEPRNQYAIKNNFAKLSVSHFGFLLNRKLIWLGSH